MSRTTAIPAFAKTLAYASAAAACALVAAFGVPSDVGMWLAALVLGAVAVGACLMEGRLSRLTTFSVIDLPMIACVLLLDPGLAILTAVAAGAFWRGRLGILSRVVNISVLAFPMAASSLTFAALRSGFDADIPRDSPAKWFGASVLAAGVYFALHYGIGGVWTRLAYRLPMRRWIQEVVLPVLKIDPFSSILAITLVEIALLLDGSARGLPVLLGAAGCAGIWISGRYTRKQVQARELKDDFFRAIFVSLARLLEMKDQETARHSARVAMFSRDIAAAMGLSNADQSRIHLAGLLHDVGKVGVPDEILLKPGRLTPEERAIMERHSRLSAEAISGIPGFSDLTRMVYAHHERLDGSGYPEGIAGAEVPLGARILGVADTFEALTSDRPYRKGRSFTEALAIFDEEGHLFDFEVVLALRQLVASGALDYKPFTMADFSDQWSRAARYLDVRLDDDDIFELPPEEPSQMPSIEELDRQSAAVPNQLAEGVPVG